MKGLRTKFERFCLKNRKIGIPNLMLFVALGSAVVFLLTKFGLNDLAGLLMFNREAILRGQVWRLLTYIFTYGISLNEYGQYVYSGVFWIIISLFCYFSLGRAMESAWGTLRFNLFYFTGVLLMDAFCMIFGGQASVNYLNLSLLIGYATLYPDARFLLFFFIPIRSWIFGMIYLGMTLMDVISIAAQGYYVYALFPLVAIGNYFLFFGKDVVNVLPPAWRRRRTPKDPKIVDVPPVRKAAPKQDKTPYTHRCVVCGRTDISHPDLEFRYCSRCKGYFCYCQDHINNHNHVE